MSESVVVLGAGGFIGRVLCETLADMGRHVVAATRRPTQFQNTGIINAVAPFDASCHFKSLLDKCPVVIHAAAATTPGSTAAQPQIEGNLRCTLALLEALHGHCDARLVYLSSGGTLYGDISSGLATECNALRPRSYHGAGKAAAEMFVHAWSLLSGGLAIVLRPSNVYGPGQLPGSGFAIVPTAFQHAIDGTPMSVWANGESIRDFLFIDDFVELCSLAIDEPLTKGVHIFNAASGETATISELLDFIDAETGRPLLRNNLPPRSVDVRRIALDTTRARQTFGWSPRLGLHEGIHLAWRWFSMRS